MSIEAVRLFELSIKGDHLHEINAEETLDRRAAAQVRAQARHRFFRLLGQQLVGWVTQLPQATVTLSSTRTN
jgi:hypothetical protein